MNRKYIVASGGEGFEEYLTGLLADGGRESCHLQGVETRLA